MDSFGVGCLHFSTVNNSNNIEGEEYIENLENALETVPNINDIQVSVGDRFIKESFNIEENNGTLDGKGSIFPPTSTKLIINYTVYIPRRIQEDLTYNDKHLDSEKFIVQMRYDPYFFPVTYVEPLSENNIYNPSTGVEIVRKFMDDKFPVSSICFDSLGPSPFHADFFLSVESSPNGECQIDGIEYEYSKKGGYDIYSILADKNHFSNLEEAKNKLYYEMKDEFGAFYFMSQGNLRRHKKWRKVSQSSNELRSLHGEEGFRGFVNRIVKTNRKLRNCFILLLDYEAMDISLRQSAERAYQNLLDERTPIIDSFLREKKERQWEFPTSQVKEILNLFEGRRRKRIEGVIVIISAILGGVVGSIMTMWLSG